MLDFLIYRMPYIPGFEEAAMFIGRVLHVSYPFAVVLLVGLCYMTLDLLVDLVHLAKESSQTPSGDL